MRLPQRGGVALFGGWRAGWVLRFPLPLSEQVGREISALGQRGERVGQDVARCRGRSGGEGLEAFPLRDDVGG